MAWYTGDRLCDSLLILGFFIAFAIFMSQKYGTAAYGGRFTGKTKGINLAHAQAGF